MLRLVAGGDRGPETCGILLHRDQLQRIGQEAQGGTAVIAAPVLEIDGLAAGLTGKSAHRWGTPVVEVRARGG
jgi:hypothetical protein